MDIQNHFYGHSGILAAYTGQTRLRHIRGLVQHGWVAHSPLLMNFGDFPAVGTPGDTRNLFVWSHTSRAWAPSEQDRETVAIGAPFCYLVELLRDIPPAVPEHERRPLIVPMHRTHVRPIASDPPSLARFYREAVGESTVCLHSEDLKDPGVVQAWRSAGHEVVSAGSRFDPQFLVRQVHGIRNASRVITNRLSTVLFYAVTAGVRASVFGPEPLAVGESRTEIDRLHELWPELHGEDVPMDQAAPAVAGEIGSAHVRPPRELAALLGWDTAASARASWDYWAGAPVGKALNVLGVTQRAGSATRGAQASAPATGAAPKPLDFLRHPLSHLPRRLPGVTEPVGPGSEWVRPA